VSDLNPDAQRLVDEAREARTPSAEDKRRMAMKLALPLATGAAAGGAASAAKAAATVAIKTPLLSGFALKLSAIVGAGVVATALVIGGRALRTKPRTPPSTTSASQPAVLAPPAPSPVAPPEAAPEPSSPPADAPPTALPRSSAAHVGKAADDLVQESELLHRAQTAWRAGQSAEALKLANQHAQRFPRSQLANERDVLRVLSLCKLGQTQAAKQVGARLLSHAKGSPWYQSVADSCAGH
jgi:hypothetical protein